MKKLRMYEAELNDGSVIVFRSYGRKGSIINLADCKLVMLNIKGLENYKNLKILDITLIK